MIPRRWRTVTVPTPATEAVSHRPSTIRTATEITCDCVRSPGCRASPFESDSGLPPFRVTAASLGVIIHCTWDSSAMTLCSPQSSSLELGVWVHRIESTTLLACSSAVISPFFSFSSPPSLPPLPPTLFHIPTSQERSQENRAHFTCPVAQAFIHTTATGRGHRGNPTGRADSSNRAVLT